MPVSSPSSLAIVGWRRPGPALAFVGCRSCVSSGGAVVVALWCCTAAEPVHSWRIINVSIVKKRQNVPCLEPSCCSGCPFWSRGRCCRCCCLSSLWWLVCVVVTEWASTYEHGGRARKTDRSWRGRINEVTSGQTLNELRNEKCKSCRSEHTYLLTTKTSTSNNQTRTSGRPTTSTTNCLQWQQQQQLGARDACLEPRCVFFSSRGASFIFTLTRFYRLYYYQTRPGRPTKANAGPRQPLKATTSPRQPTTVDCSCWVLEGSRRDTSRAPGMFSFFYILYC